MGSQGKNSTRDSILRMLERIEEESIYAVSFTGRTIKRRPSKDYSLEL